MPLSWDEKDLRALFEPLGTVARATVPHINNYKTRDGLSVILPLPVRV
jgi:hypothetical protein